MSDQSVRSADDVYDHVVCAALAKAIGRLGGDHGTLMLDKASPGQFLDEIFRMAAVHHGFGVQHAVDVIRKTLASPAAVPPPTQHQDLTSIAISVADVAVTAAERYVRIESMAEELQAVHGDLGEKAQEAIDLQQMVNDQRAEIERLATEVTRALRAAGSPLPSEEPLAQGNIPAAIANLAGNRRGEMGDVRASAFIIASMSLAALAGPSAGYESSLREIHDEALKLMQRAKA